MLTTEKACAKCQHVQPIEQFAFHNQGGNRRNTCRRCVRDRLTINARTRYHASEENRQYSKTQSYQWRLAHPEKYQIYLRRSRLEQKYGLTLAQFDELIQRQGGVCALCKTTKPGGAYKKVWHVDHCHETGRVRGLLCHTCNVRVGSYERLIKMVGHDGIEQYLNNGGPYVA